MLNPKIQLKGRRMRVVIVTLITTIFVWPLVYFRLYFGRYSHGNAQCAR